eukprot:9496703-Pyramimonas_sp.AAC.1
MEGAWDCLTKDEMEAASERKDTKESMKAQKKLYCTSYNEWMKATNPAKGGGRSKSQWKPSDWKGPAKPPDRAIEQPEAKLPRQIAVKGGM